MQAVDARQWSWQAEVSCQCLAMVLASVAVKWRSRVVTNHRHRFVLRVDSQVAREAITKHRPSSLRLKHMGRRVPMTIILRALAGLALA